MHGHGRFFLVAAALTGLATMVGCGSDTPAGPSNGRLKLQGIVLQDGSSAQSQSADVSALSTAGGRITVTVKEDGSISTKVAGNGTFELTGVPATGFTLVFSVDGAVLGTISISPIQEGTTIKIVVKVRDGRVELVSLDTKDQKDENQGNQDGGASKDCIINGGKVGSRIELEGNVDSGGSDSFRLRVNGNRASDLVDVLASGATFRCKGDKTSSDACKASVKAGAKVHVRGTLTSCTTSAANVTATEVKVQKD